MEYLKSLIAVIHFTGILLTIGVSKKKIQNANRLIHFLKFERLNARKTQAVISSSSHIPKIANSTSFASMERHSWLVVRETCYSITSLRIVSLLKVRDASTWIPKI